MDRITSLQSFMEVARCSSFTKAADNIGLSRLQVTRHVQDIEQWLGLRLFHRTTRKVSLTMQGEEALGFAKQILSSVSDLQSRAHSHNHELVGTIRVATPIGLGQNMLFDAIQAFVSIHPKTHIQMVLIALFTVVVINGGLCQQQAMNKSACQGIFKLMKWALF